MKNEEFESYRNFGCGILVLLAFIFLSAILVTVGCTREQLQNPDTQEAGIELKYNGVLKQYAQVSGTGTSNLFSFVGTNTPATQSQFRLVFAASGFGPGTYMVNDSGLVIYREGAVIASRTSSQGFTVTITANSGGIVTGTFQGTVTDQNGQPAVISEGKINAIQLYE